MTPETINDTTGAGVELRSSSEKRMVGHRELEPSDERRESSGLVGVGGVRFTLDDAQKASDEWRFNCGPGALCAMLDMTPDELRPHMLDFEEKGYTNPTLMTGVLDRLGVTYRQVYRSDEAFPTFEPPWHKFSLVRIQWDGPWTNPGVPMRARYRQTHWVGCRNTRGFVSIFDVNAMCVGGWLPFQEWAFQLVPWLIRECVPKGSGKWWPTHGLEILSGRRGCGAGDENRRTDNGAQVPNAKLCDGLGENS